MKLVLILSGILISYTVFSQKPVCGIDNAGINLISRIPAVDDDWKKTNKLISINAAKGRSGVQGLITIPVVVHVIYNSPSENISDAQVHSQIDVLNTDFRRLNADTNITRNIFKPFAGDSHIEFCLAQRDPNGDTTSGITRTLTTHASWDCTDSMKYTAYGGKDPWPNTDYLNIWVVNLNCANGYAYYPGTPAPYDGVVIHYYVFGNTGNVAPGHTGRTAVHEVGHYLGLYHTFEYGICNGTDTSTCIGGGDYVCDTPGSDAPGYGCDTTLNTCTDSPFDFPNQIENYMDYADDICRNMFSLGQISRMRAALSSYRISLLTSIGCISPLSNYYDISAIELMQPLQEMCISAFNPILKIGNTGNTTLSSFIVHYQLDGSFWSQFNWTGSLNGGAITFVTLPSINIVPGSHNFSCYVSDPDGMPDQNASNDILNVLFNVLTTGNGLTIPYTEEFETSIFPPAGWYIENPGYNQVWKKFSSAGGFGNSNSSAYYQSFYNGGTNSQDRLITPKFDLTSVSDAFISFDVAYSQPASSFSADTLKIYYSTDCGQNWNKIWEKGGNNLSTAPTPVTFDEFIPDSTQWRTETVNASAAIGNHLVSFMFEECSNWSNNLYLDNINITNSTSIKEDNNHTVTIFPNPSNGIIFVELNNKVSGFYYDVFSILGNEIISSKSNGNRLQLNLSNLSTGFYFVRIEFNGTIISKHFSIIH